MLTMTGDYCRRVSLICFFQAEAGIRDIGVTGVQTCALPILAVDRGRRMPADRPDSIAPGLVLFVGRVPGDVVDGAGALEPAPGRRRVVGVRAATELAAGFPAVAGGDERERLLEHRTAALWIDGVGPHAVEALERVLGRDLGMLGDQWLVGYVQDRQLVPESLRVREPKSVAVALRRNALAGQPLGPEVERAGAAHAPNDPMDHARAGAAGGDTGIFEERQVQPGRGVFIAVEEVVDGGVVLVDGLRSEERRVGKEGRSRGSPYH